MVESLLQRPRFESSQNPDVFISSQRFLNVILVAPVKERVLLVALNGGLSQVSMFILINKAMVGSPSLIFYGSLRGNLIIV